MISFGKKIAILRKEKGLSQGELATQLKTSVSVISRYERDEMIPSIEAAKKLADLLGSTVGYLLGENEESNIFKDPEILDRFKAIKAFKDEDKEKIYFTIDALIHEITNRKRYATK
jgi:transcriptional regulator with XRE-family HTH domain